MELKEFYGLWSSLRLGMLLGLVPEKFETMNVLLEQAQNAHLMAYTERQLSGADLNTARASRIRELLSYGE